MTLTIVSGNHRGVKPYVSGASCSSCPGGYTCSGNLCVNGSDTSSGSGDLQPLTQETKTFPVRKTQLSFFLMLKLKDKWFLSLKNQSFSSYNARYYHNLYEFADLEGWKGVCPPPFLEKSSLVKTPQKITENRFWSKRLPNWGVIFFNWRRFPLTNADYIIVILSFSRNKDANIDP